MWSRTRVYIRHAIPSIRTEITKIKCQETPPWTATRTLVVGSGKWRPAVVYVVISGYHFQPRTTIKIIRIQETQGTKASCMEIIRDTTTATTPRWPELVADRRQPVVVPPKHQLHEKKRKGRCGLHDNVPCFHTRTCSPSSLVFRQPRPTKKHPQSLLTLFPATSSFPATGTTTASARHCCAAVEKRQGYKAVATVRWSEHRHTRNTQFLCLGFSFSGGYHWIKKRRWLWLFRSDGGGGDRMVVAAMERSDGDGVTRC